MRLLLLLAMLMIFSAVWGQMLAPGVGLRGQYYATGTLTGPALTRYDAGINLTWTAEAMPLADLKPGAFSVQWRGSVLPAFSEKYTFTIASTGGVRLMVNEKRIIDDWAPHALKAVTGTISLQAGKLTPINLRTTQPAGAGAIKLQWASPSRPLEIIPASRLYPPLFDPALLVYSDNADPKVSALNLMALDGVPKKLTVAGSSQPVFMPGGKRILFRTTQNMTNASSAIFQVATSGREQMQLTRPGGERYDPAISANGQKIAYTEFREGAWEIWTIRPDGTRRTAVIQNEYENRHPALSPDGSYLIYQSKRNGQWNLYRVNIDGSEEVALTTNGGSEPTINRQGTLVLYVAAPAGRPQLFTMKPDGSAQTLLVETTGAVSQPFFFRGTQAGWLEKNAKGATNLFLVDCLDRIPCQVTSSGKLAQVAMADVVNMPSANNLVLWLNAQYVSSLNLDADGRVAAWQDASPRGYAAAQDNPEARPLFLPTGMNGNPVVQWDGNDTLRTSDLSGAWNGPEATLVMLYAPAEIGDYTVIHQDNGAGGEHWRYGGDGNGYLGLFMPNRHEQYPQGMPDRGPHLLTLVSGAQYTAYIDGVPQPPRGANFLAPTTLTIGAGGNAAPFRGGIAQLAVFNRALTDEERQTVESYFRTLYGL